MSAESTSIQQKYYDRFGPGERAEHLVMMISFIMLAATGLPQRYADYELAKNIIDAMGGIESVRIMHRFFAVILMAMSIYHGGVVSYKIYVLSQPLTMLPGLRDARDLLHYVLHNLGLRQDPPQMPRYNFGEKAEYLALVWGTIIMILTGFMMWNPVATAKLLPAVAIPAAQAAHSAEAVLAILAVIIWHMYNVHVKRFNRAMFTGKISHEAMEEEHAEELAAIQQGKADFKVPTTEIAKRQMRFLPYAIVMTTILTGGLVFFVTFETTALETVPRQPSTDISGVEAAVGNAALGETLWSEFSCHTCHGQDGAGVDAVPPINGDAVPTIEAFAIAVRRGPADMPAFTRNQISDEEIAHLYAWLQTHE